MYGGVIRYAAGTSQAGQIVCHLLPASQMLSTAIPVAKAISSLYTAYQVQHLRTQVAQVAQTIQQLLHLTTGTAVVAGLSLAVSSLGFRRLDKKLTDLEQQIQALRVEVKEIRRIMEQKEHIMLRSALHDVSSVHEQPEAHRQTILLIAKDKLQQLHEHYRIELSAANNIEQALSFQEYTVISALAMIRCYGELAMFQQASQAMDELKTLWMAQARRIAKTWLLGESPERFLYRDFIRDVSVTNLVAWLDFAHDSQKGYLWLDELRQKSDSWYGLSQVRRPALKTSTASQSLSREKNITIPALHQMFARQQVLEGYVSQYALLEQAQMKPHELEEHIAAVPEADIVNGYIMLAPELTA